MNLGDELSKEMLVNLKAYINMLENALDMKPGESIVMKRQQPRTDFSTLVIDFQHYIIPPESSVAFNEDYQARLRDGWRIEMQAVWPEAKDNSHTGNFLYCILWVRDEDETE